MATGALALSVGSARLTHGRDRRKRREQVLDASVRPNPTAVDAAIIMAIVGIECIARPGTTMRMDGLSHLIGISR